jgi:two-component system, cell cycle sensor histidine kinase and response regulator CckA
MDNSAAFSAETEKADGILVVDDDVQVLKFVARMLGSLGYRSVFQAASTDEAHQIWGEQRANIGLVITDFVMPQQTGDVMALEMKKADAGLKILLISGNDPLTLDSEIPLNPGINFLQKPFTVAEIRKSILTLAQCA